MHMHGAKGGVVNMAMAKQKADELKARIAELPSGYISRKTINGKVQLYYQWTEAGKKRSKYLSDDLAAETARLIEERHALQEQLKALRVTEPKAKRPTSITHTFQNLVITGTALQDYVQPVKAFRQRDCMKALEEYLHNGISGKVFILYGLRRTGKTTMIRQSIASMSNADLSKTAFIQIQQGNTLGEINMDLQWLQKHGCKFVFIDEVTYAEDFIEGAALFSDIYAASGIKIVLSGTDSLGFAISAHGELYDRCIMQHTTWIPYREFVRVLGIEPIDEYIRYGGTMSLSGTYYNQTSTFANKESTDEYIDSAIAHNIQHSLKYYQYGDHFRHLGELFERNELTSAINRVVEDINHRFTIDVLTRDFISHDLGISAKNLRKDRLNPTDILDRIDKTAFTEGLRKALEILNKPEQTVEIKDVHRAEIKEYLDLLDLTVDIPTEFLPVRNERIMRTAIAQPGLRYAQAEALVRQLLQDASFQNISAVDRAWILERVLDEIRGRMMEDIVLLETKKAHPQKTVARLQFTIGEFDMIVADPNDISCEIYEIKHSKEPVPEQYRFLIDPEKCRETEFRYGQIKGKYVIYRGGQKEAGEITYLNVEEYLKSLPCIPRSELIESKQL